jgi:RNA polymerase sigma-70 factor (ECF subfamily)
MKRSLRFERQDGAALEVVLLNNERQDSVIEREYDKVLGEAVSRLSPQQRQVYRLIREQGYKRDEAAVLMNISAETVKSYLAEAMRHIRRYCLTYLKIVFWILYLRRFL